MELQINCSKKCLKSQGLEYDFSITAKCDQIRSSNPYKFSHTRAWIDLSSKFLAMIQGTLTKGEGSVQLTSLYLLVYICSFRNYIHSLLFYKNLASLMRRPTVLSLLYQFLNNDTIICWVGVLCTLKKQATLIRRSIVLGLPYQLVFPKYSHILSRGALAT